MTRTSAQNKALTAVEDKSLTPDYTEPGAAPETEDVTKPETKAVEPAAPSAPKPAAASTVDVIWAQHSHGRKPGDKVQVSAEEARAMIHAGYAAKA